MLVAYARAVITHHTEVLCKSPVVGDTNPSLAISSQVFTIVEAKTADVSQTPNPRSSIGSTMCLRSIFNNSETVRTCKIQYRLHFDWMTIEMDGDNGTSARGQRRAKLPPIHSISEWIDIDKDRGCSYESNCFNRGNKGIGYRDNFIARANVTDSKSQGERVGSRSYSYCLITSTISRKFDLEGPSLWAEDTLHDP